MLNIKAKKGIAIYLAIVIFSLLSIIALGLYFVISRKIVQVRETGYSVKAFFASDSGIEEALFKLYKQNQSLPFSFSDSLNGANFSVEALDSTSPQCSAQYYCIRSVGFYKEISRAIEASF